MKKRIMVIGAGMAMAAMLSSGCASYMVVQGRNAELDRRAVQLAVTPNGGTAAIDLLGLKGYWEAWKAEPVKMTGATTMTEDEWFEGYIGQGPCTASLPDGWKTWDGWRKYVTTNAK